MSEAHIPSYSRLAALQAALDAKGFETGLGMQSLIVIAPLDGTGPRLADTVVCRLRLEDDGRLWFITSGGIWLGAASDATDAIVALTVHLSPS